MSRTRQGPYAPAGGYGQAIVRFGALRQRSTRLSSGRVQVWLADATRRRRWRVTAVTGAPKTAGVGVMHHELPAVHPVRQIASAWGLQLAHLVEEISGGQQQRGRLRSRPRPQPRSAARRRAHLRPDHINQGKLLNLLRHDS